MCEQSMGTDQFGLGEIFVREMTEKYKSLKFQEMPEWYTINFISSSQSQLYLTTNWFNHDYLLIAYIYIPQSFAIFSTVSIPPLRKNKNKKQNKQQKNRFMLFHVKRINS